LGVSVVVEVVYWQRLKKYQAYTANLPNYAQAGTDEARSAAPGAVSPRAKEA
jgi:hypothetical protein